MKSHPDYLRYYYEYLLKRKLVHLKCQALHLDPWLLLILILLSIVGLFILYSASNENMVLIHKQGIRLMFAFIVMLIFAQIPPQRYYQWAPGLFVMGIVLLVLVLVIGKLDQGARRWLNFGFFQLQPSEIMKLAVPMLLARYLSDNTMPPKLSLLPVCLVLLIIPATLTAKQPDLGTAIIVVASGLCVLLLSGLSWKVISGALIAITLSIPVVWHFMHDYQQERILSFLNPERDPLGSGYNIIQSKIALGSGGIFGKGWLEGTQSHLQFLPAHATDFIFAVSGEELGFIGSLILLTLFLAVLARGLYISSQAQNTFTRLLAGSLSLTFILSAFINISMVCGILPVVGIPLPLVSYGGSSIVIMMISLGMVMSIQSHRTLWAS